MIYNVFKVVWDTYLPIDINNKIKYDVIIYLFPDVTLQRSAVGKIVTYETVNCKS